MADSPRDPWHLNGREVAKWLGVSTKTVSQRNYPNLGKHGAQVIYDIREVLRIEGAKGLVISSDGETIDHDIEKARLTKEQRIAKELENAETQRRLRPVEEVEAAIYDALSPVASALDSLPMSIKRACPELSQHGVELVEREIATMRNALADDHIFEPSEESESEPDEGSVSADGS